MNPLGTANAVAFIVGIVLFLLYNIFFVKEKAKSPTVTYKPLISSGATFKRTVSFILLLIYIITIIVI